VPGQLGNRPARLLRAKEPQQVTAFSSVVEVAHGVFLTATFAFGLEFEEWLANS
jgi:hypothetical protein